MSAPDELPLGWTAARAEAARALDPDGAWTPVRIAAEHRGAYRALGPGGLAWVELTGKAFHTAEDKRALPTVGDYVLVERWAEARAEHGAGIVRAILPRASFLVRKAAGEATLPQPIAANVDRGFVLTSANADLSPARLDRYLALLRDGGIAPALVLTKIDLVEADAAAAMCATLAEVAAGAPVVAIAAPAGRGTDAIRALVAPGETAVLLGSSGVGKSTLLNALARTRQETGAIRADERGRHTTTHRELFVADDLAWIDTPGMRELAQWLDGDDDAVAALEGEVAALAATCRFRDCTHRKEPGCAVVGTLAPARLASYHKLADERAAAAQRQAAAQRIAETRRASAKKYAKKRDEP